MKVYLDVAFLEAFENEVDYDNQCYNIVFDILTKYPQVKIYSDIAYQTVDEIEQVKNKFKTLNLYLAAGNNISETNDIEATLRQDHFDGDLVFMFKEQPWFHDANKNGILCFSINNYKEKIKTLLSFHYKIDLSEKGYLFSWNKLRFASPTVQITINDNYILTDTSNQNKEKNLFKLLSEIQKTNSSLNKINIFTKIQDERQDKKRALTILQSKVSRLKEIFIDCEIYVVNIKDNYFHDRYILSKFQLIECGKGFNLMPHTPSNSQIFSTTIFDFYSYKRIKNLKKAHDEHHIKMTNDSPFFATIFTI